MKKSIFLAISLLSFVMSPLSHAALIKDTYTTNFTYGGLGLLIWSVTYSDTASSFTTYLDGSNGKGEFGLNDDLIDIVGSFQEQIDDGTFEYVSDALFEIDSILNAVNQSLLDGFGTQLSDYDQSNYNFSYSFMYKGLSLGEVAWLFADGFTFNYDNSLGSPVGSVASFQLFGPCTPLPGTNCTGQPILSVGGATELVSREFLQVPTDVAAPNSLAIFGISLLFLVRRISTKA